MLALAPGVIRMAADREMHGHKTRVYLVIVQEEPIHPEIVCDDLAAILDAAGYTFTIEAEDGND